MFLSETSKVGVIVAITYKDEQNIFIKLQIYCELVFSFLPQWIFCGREAVV